MFNLIKILGKRNTQNVNADINDLKTLICMLMMDQLVYLSDTLSDHF